MRSSISHLDMRTDDEVHLGKKKKKKHIVYVVWSGLGKEALGGEKCIGGKEGVKGLE